MVLGYQKTECCTKVCEVTNNSVFKVGFWKVKPIASQ